MNISRLASVLVSPVVTEKAATAEGHGQYVFRVATWATKGAVRAAVKAMFGIDVVSVNIINQKGKAKLTGRGLGRRKNFKKAYVKLVEGQVINIEAAE